MNRLKALEILKWSQDKTQNNNLDFLCGEDWDNLIKEAIKELEELQNRKCINCKYSPVRFNIDCNLINKLDLPEKFCCNKWEKKA